ncbi:MAG: amidohydrolase family protein [Beijerinckiaceae bacterium]
MRHSLFALLLAVPALTSPATAQQPMPIFDAHVHYSHDAVQLVPPKEAVAILRKAGLKKVLLSSSDDDGTQKLHAEAHDIVVPSLRPYRNRSDTTNWTNDPAIITYVEDRLKRFKYSAIGEFHAFNADIDKPVVQRIIALAKQYNLLLHAHSDADAIDRIFKTYPDAKVLWAHSGFERPEKVREMLRKHKNLWADLAFRNEHAQGDSVAPDWRAAFDEFPERFMVGTDTFTPERWHYIGSHADTSRRWLASLPKAMAEGIAYRNAEVMLSHVSPVNPSSAKGTN